MFVLLLILSLVLVFILKTKKFSRVSPSTVIPSATNTQKASQSTLLYKAGREVVLSSPDGYSLSATYWANILDATPPLATVILVHQFGSDRHDYDSFIPLLLSNKYSVLAYDIRGFGLSSNGVVVNLDDFSLDVSAALNFLKNQPVTSSQKIGIIGASVGANVAYVASGSQPTISATVALSPSNTGPNGVLMGKNTNDFSPHNILIASDQNEKADATFIFNNASEIKQQKTYPNYGHGVSLLKSKQAQIDILDFLNALL